MESAVNDILVTPPSNLHSSLILKSFWFNLANAPSPHPTIKSPLGNNSSEFTPCENIFLLGPALLKIALSIAISNISPVLVPHYTNASLVDITRLVICLLI